MNPQRPLHLSQEGSISVLVAFMLPVLCLMIILISNIGQLVFDKIRLQTTVDACALAAAGVQATGLNEIADLNYELKREFNDLKYNVLLRPLPLFWDNMAEGMKAIKYYEDVFRSICDYQDKANVFYERESQSVAQKVKDMNQPKDCIWILKHDNNSKLTERRKLQEEVSFTYIEMECQGISCIPLVPTKIWNDPNPMAESKNYYYPHYMGMSISTKRHPPVTSLYSKEVIKCIEKTGKKTSAAYILIQNSRPYILGSSIFKLTPELTAFAEAQPTGGNIKKCEPKYKPVLIK